jgi:hypothetical protein
MRLLIVFSVFATLLAAADKPVPKTKPAVKATTVKPLEIPAGAVESEPGGWHYTDAQGKKWVYRKTPFGVARMEDKPDTRPAPAVKVEDVKATESGEYILFERPGPFGIYKWQTKKSDLNELEQAAWNRARTPRQD